VSPLRRALSLNRSLDRRAAVATIAGLPAYQVALWPDGWDLGADGSVLVRDTHAMAEARRWYALARRNGSRADPGPVLALHRLNIPEPLLDLVLRRFPSEQVASVAVMLVAGDWLGRRRAQLARTAEAALTERAATWTGSRHGLGLDGNAIPALIWDVLGLCLSEGLIPPADYGLKVRRDDGWGLCGYRVRLAVPFGADARSKVAEVLSIALIPWNRAAAGEAGPHLVIRVEVCPRSRQVLVTLPTACHLG
jgi:hypothetical protein